MKKFSLLQTVLVAALALFIGLFIGLSMADYTPQQSNNDTEYYEMAKYLGGSIGKVDRYRNVKVTEDDILLRNELVEDSLKRNQYEKFLMYHYYQAAKTSMDVEEVLKKTSQSQEFMKVYYPYINALESFKAYLVPAREDILFALNMVISLDSNANIPVIGYLNQAQNAIARVQSHQTILLNLKNAITTFIDTNPEGKFFELEDAHDIISLNLMQSAVLMQNKPMMTYLEKSKIYNSKEGVKELVAEASLKSYMNDAVLQDIQSLDLVASNEQLSVIILLNTENLNVFYSTDQLQSITLGSEEILRELAGSVENLGGGYTDVEMMGFVDVVE